MVEITKHEPIFSSYGSLLTFVVYIALFVNQGILVTASKSLDNTYDYCTIAAVLATETLKLIICIGIYLVDKTPKELWSEATHNLKVLALYTVPAALYCFYNNLAFTNLQNFDPTTYYVFLQLRVVVTGLIYQSLFRRKLTRWQWFSLLVLTLGCITKNWGNVAEEFHLHSFFNQSLVPLFAQILCSCLAGVYNEYLLKSSGSNADVMIQNIYMYIDSILCNILVLKIFSNPLPNYTNEVLRLLKPSIIAVIINNALCGIVTSIFLKKLNSILKNFASAIELVFTALLSYIFFSIPIDIFTILSILIVSYATWLYFQHPIHSESSKLAVQYSKLKVFEDEKAKSYIDHV